MLGFHWIVLTPMLTLNIQQPASQPAESSEPAPSTPAAPAGFLYKTAEFRGAMYAYCVYVPPEYTPEQAWPVILFLHGSGERGADGLKQTDVGLAHAIRRNRRLVPALVVMPQCPDGRTWDEEMARMALHCLEVTSLEYHLDRERVYLTGLSLGGAGTWLIGSKLADRFAALVPICGFGDVSTAPELAKVPIWCFHGSADDRVPVERSREMVAAIRKAGGDVQYTEYEGGKHNVWDRAYRDPSFWQWLLAQKRAS